MGDGYFESYIRSSRDAVPMPLHILSPLTVSDPGRRPDIPSGPPTDKLQLLRPPPHSCASSNQCLCASQTELHPQCEKILSSKSCQAVEFTSTICSQHDRSPHPSESSLIIRTWPQSVPATSLSSNCPQITSPHPHPLSQNRPKTKRYNRQAWDSPSPASEEASNGLVLAGLVHLRRVKADDISALVRHGGLLHRGARGGRLPSLEACPSPC